MLGYNILIFVKTFISSSRDPLGLYNYLSVINDRKSAMLSYKLLNKTNYMKNNM